MRVLVTGIAGCVGSHVADRLLASGHEVVGIDDLTTGHDRNVPAVPWVAGDITVPGHLVNTVWDEGLDAIVHCAATYADPTAWADDLEVNAGGSLAVGQLALEHDARVIYMQTSLCYGPVDGMVSETQPLNPRGSYAVSKTCGELVLRGLGVDLVVLRLANMIGPRNLTGPLPVFWRQLVAGEQSTVADARRDFVDIRDLAALVEQALLGPAGVYHASSGGDVTILELYQEVAHAVGEAEPRPRLVDRGPDDVPRLLLDPRLTARTFGWAPTTPLGESVADACEWYTAHGAAETFSHLRVG